MWFDRVSYIIKITFKNQFVPQSLWEGHYSEVWAAQEAAENRELTESVTMSFLLPFPDRIGLTLNSY